MVLHIITYATHSEGLYNKLIYNKFNINIKVLGWDDEWVDFMQKIREVIKYLEKLDDNDVVVFLDGFDTLINRDGIDEIIPFLKNSNKKVIFSSHPTVFGLEKIVFDKCVSNYIANTGLYMGYAKYILILLKSTQLCNCKDDQVNVNRMCKNFNFVGIDIDNIIFENLSNKSKQSKAVFIQYPGTITFNRTIRGVKEYTQFFINYLIIINIILVLYFVRFKKKISFIILLLFNLILFSYIDTSCI